MKDCFLEEAVDVCGETRGIARQKESGGGMRRLQPW